MNHVLFVASVWLHVMAAALWIGGMLFLTLVLVPSVRRLEDRALATLLIRDTGRRFRLVGWIALVVLVLTGLSNLSARGISHQMLLRADFWSGPYGQVLAFKVGVVTLILVLSAFHDFLFGPRASAALSANAASPEARRLRRIASWFGRLNLVLALVVVACGVMLVRGRPW
jgi:uncharacterized membrane protein